MAKPKVVHKWVVLGWVQSFMLILGRIELDHFTSGSGWVGSRKLDPRPTVIISDPSIVQRYNFLPLNAMHSADYATARCLSVR